MGSTQVPGQTLSIVMEYIPGGSLANLLTKPIDFQFKCKLASDVAKGMAFLHSMKIYHRDLKPDNILVVNFSDTGGVNLKVSHYYLTKAYSYI